MSIKNGLVSLLLVMLCSALPVKANAAAKRILFISSYNSSYPSYFAQIEGIRSVFDTVDVKIDIESMDSKRYSSVKHVSLFNDLLTDKIKSGVKYDVVLVSDDNAFNYAAENKDSLFKDVPIVFFAVNDVKRALQQNAHPNVTGFVEDISIQATIDLMLNLFPQSNEVYVLSDDTFSSKAILLQFRRIAKQYTNITFKELLLGDLSFEELGRELRKIDRNTPVLLFSAYKDKNKQILEIDEGVSFIKQNLDAPIFYLWYYGGWNGILGGKVISHKEHAKNAALRAYDILKGKHPSYFKVTNQSPNSYVFNYNELQKFDIELSRLPKESLIIHTPDSRFVSLYKDGFFTVLAFAITFLILICYLLITIRKRFKVENNLRVTVEKYASLNKEYLSLNEEYQNTNESLRDANIDLMDAQKRLTFKREELKASEERFRVAITAANQGVWDWNVETNEVFFSSRWKEMLGYNDHDLPDEKDILATLLNPNDIKYISGVMHNMIKGAIDKYEVELRMKHKTDGDLHVLCKGMAVKNAQGEVYRIVGTQHDLTDRYNYEHKLKEQLDENRALYVEYRSISEELDSKNKHLLKVEEDLRVYIAKLNQKNVQLSESEQKYRQLFDNMSQAFGLFEIMLDDDQQPVDYVIRDVNPILLKAYNLQFGEVVNKKGSDLSIYCVERWIHRFGEIATTGGVDKFVEYVPEIDKYYEMNVFSPKKNFFAIIFDDITDSVKAKEALLAEKSRSEDIVRGTNASTWDWNIKTDALIVNKRWGELIGYTLNELQPINSSLTVKHMHPDDQQSVGDELRSVFSKELDYFDVEFRMKHKSGHWIWVHCRGGVVEWDTDDSAIRMTGTHLDVTDKKKAELALIESEKRFKLIFDMSKAIMLLIDPQTRIIVDANDSAAKFYGYDRSQLLGMNMSRINILSVDRITKEMETAQKEERNIFKFQHILSSGDIRDVDVVVSPVVVNNKKIEHSIIIDTTKAVEAEYQIQQVNKRFVGLENIVHYNAKSINDLLDFTLKQSIHFTESQLGAVYHFDSEKGIFFLNNWSQDVNLTHQVVYNQDEIDNMDCLNKAALSREVVIVNNPQLAYPFLSPELFNGGLLKSITIPVIANDKVVSLFWLATKNNLYSKFHAEQLMLLLDTAWILVEKQRLQD